jgi:hypothetical protein
MKLVVIPCGGAKLTAPAPARELYIGSMFRDQLATALTMTTPENVRILSAKHGLLTLDEIVEPYDVKMGSGDDVTIGRVADQLEAATGGPFQKDVTIEALLPKKYAQVLEAARRFYPVKNHFAGCAGIGYQKQVLKQIRTKKES